MVSARNRLHFNAVALGGFLNLEMFGAQVLDFSGTCPLLCRCHPIAIILPLSSHCHPKLRPSDITLPRRCHSSARGPEKSAVCMAVVAVFAHAAMARCMPCGGTRRRWRRRTAPRWCTACRSSAPCCRRPHRQGGGGVAEGGTEWGGGGGAGGTGGRCYAQPWAQASAQAPEPTVAWPEPGGTGGWGPLLGNPAPGPGFGPGATAHGHKEWVAP